MPNLAPFFSMDKELTNPARCLLASVRGYLLTQRIRYPVDCVRAFAALIFKRVAFAAAIFFSDFEAPPLAPSWPITAETAASGRRGETGAVAAAGAGVGGACKTGSRKSPRNPAHSAGSSDRFPSSAAHAAISVSARMRWELSGGMVPGQASLAAAWKRCSCARNAVAASPTSFT